MTLIELMVALAIGVFLMIGAVSPSFSRAARRFRITENVSRLQENARFALDALEPDIRMAHFWGLTARTTKSSATPAPRIPNGLGPGDLRQQLDDRFRRRHRGTNGAPMAVGLRAPPARRSKLRHAGRAPGRPGRARRPAPLTAATLYIHSARASTARLFAGTAGARRLHARQRAKPTGSSSTATT